MRLAWFALAACGSRAVATQSTLANKLPAASEPEAISLEGKCGDIGPVGIQVVICTTATHEEDPGNPDTLKVSDMSGHLIVALHGKAVADVEVQTWSQGWEWGGGVSVEGVLVAPDGSKLVLVVYGTSNVDDHEGGLIAYRQSGATFDEMYRMAAYTLEVTVKGDRAEIVACTGQPSGTPPTCPKERDASTVLAWDGKHVKTR